MPELFVGKSQQDEGEPDTFDGTLWALPTAQARIDEAGGGPECDITLIAEHIREEEDAERLAHSWNCHEDLVSVLAVCRAALEARLAMCEILDQEKTLLDVVRCALAKAEGANP
jgi:hypothetical protein